MKSHLLIVVLLLLNSIGPARAADGNPALNKPASKPLAVQPVVAVPEQSGNDRHKSRAVTSQDFSPMASPMPAASVHKVKATPHQTTTATRPTPKGTIPAPTSPVPIPYPLMKTKPDSETSKPSDKSPFAAKSKKPDSTEPEH